MSFLDVIGQQRVAEILSRAILSNRVAHAYLFHGPPGIGKMAMALELAKAVNCAEREGDACDACLSCRKIDPRIRLEQERAEQVSPQEDWELLVEENRHPDLFHLDTNRVDNKGRPLDKSKRKKQLSVDDVRKLQRMIYLHPLEGRRRVVVVQRAEQMSAGGANTANAFLKLLEEPPEATVLILVTSALNQVLETIRSRCQKIGFAPLAAEQIAKMLMRDEQVSSQDASFLAGLAEGSLTKARAYAGSGMIEKRRAWLSGWLELKDPDSALQFVDGLVKDKPQVELFLELLLRYYRDAAVLAATGETERVVNQDYLEPLQQAARRAPLPLLIGMYTATQQAYQALKLNVGPTDLLFRLFLYRTGKVPMPEVVG